MKTIIFLLVSFIFSNLLLYSQDIEPIQQQFLLNGQNIYLSGDSAYFKQNTFILGWAWLCGKTMSKNMLDNQAQVASRYPRYWMRDSVNLVINTDNVWDNGAGSAASNSQSIVYSPVLLITNPETQKNIRQNDPETFNFRF